MLTTKRKNRWLCLIIAALLTLSAVGCSFTQSKVEQFRDRQQTKSTSDDSTEYEIHNLNIQVPEHHGYFMYDSGFVLQNGNIVIQKFKSMLKGNTYYQHYIYNIDGTRLQHGNDEADYYRLVLETDEGNIIITDDNGNTTVFDSAWNPIETDKQLTFYHGYSLDDGKYFAINDEYMYDFEYAHGVDSVEKDVKFALYRYTEKLTDCIFSKIVPCENGFECFYTDVTSPEDSIVIEADDMSYSDEDFLSVVYDDEIQKYSCFDGNGDPLFNMSFDFVTKPKHNSAIAYMEKSIYLIHLSDNNSAAK